MKRSVLYTLFFVALFVFCLSQVSFSSARPQPSKQTIGACEQTVPEWVRSAQAAEQQQTALKAKHRYLLASDDPPPPPPPDPDPCPCPENPPPSPVEGGTVFGAIACGGDCTNNVCPYNDRPNEDLNKCVLEHEQSHFNDPQTTCGEEGFLEADPPEHNDEAECKAFQTQLFCLNRALNNAPQDKRGEITEEIMDVGREIDRYCKPANQQSSSPSPAPTPVPPTQP